MHLKNCLRESLVVNESCMYEKVDSIYLMWNFNDRSEIFQTRFIPISLCHRQEAPSTVRVKIQWNGEIERTMAYISFLTLRCLEIWHACSKNSLSIMRHGSRFYISHVHFLFLLGVLSGWVAIYSVYLYPELNVDSFLFYVVLFTNWVRT